MLTSRFLENLCTPVLEYAVTGKIMTFKVARDVLWDVTSCSFVDRYQL